MRLAVIPARGGSKRIPRKNVRPFAGLPMIAHALRCARRSGVFDRIVVSTDDAEIAAIAREHGADTPFQRPAALADDHTPTVPVIAHALDALQLPDDAAVCCLYPGVPLLDPALLRSALAVLEGGATGFVFPVAAHPSPVQRALLRAADGSSRPMQPEHSLTRTQDLPPAYFDAGQFYWGRAAAWRAGLPIHQHAHTLVLPAWSVVDIDTEEDWQRAERLYQAWQPAATTGPV